MKKLLTAALGALMIFGMAACNGGGGAKYSEEILADKVEGETVHFTNNSYGPWAPVEACKMEATSVAKVAELDAAVAKTLSKRKLDFLYIAKNVVLDESVEERTAGWPTNIKVNGEVVAVDGARCIKAMTATYDSENETYKAKQWIPDPKLANVENLTPSTLFVSPNWAEEADADGFDWTTNPAALEAGTYTLVVAKYTAASAAGVYGYGMALIK